MFKDRLSEVKKFQDKDDRSRKVEVEVSNGNDGAQLRGIFERADVIGQWITTMEQNNSKIKQDVTKLLDVNHRKVEESLKSLFDNNLILSKQISDKLKQIEEELKQNSEKSTAENRILKIQHSTLKKRCEDAFLENFEHLDSYKGTMREIIRMQSSSTGKEIELEELDRLIDEGTQINIFIENHLAETVKAKRILADVEDRYQRLLQIEKMITDVRDLFLQLSILVDDQQQLVDRIEYQAEIAATTINAVDLRSVRKSKTRHLKRKICLISTLVIFLLILILALVRPGF